MKAERRTITGQRGQYVYVLQSGADGPIKVGRTVRLFKRIETLQGGNPIKLEILHEVAGGNELEKYLHRQLKPERIHGEWFEYTEHTQKVIDELIYPEVVWSSGIPGDPPKTFDKDYTPAPEDNLEPVAVLRRKTEGSSTYPCPLCGKTHHHGTGNGYRATHCITRFGEQQVSGRKLRDGTPLPVGGYYLITEEIK